METYPGKENDFEEEDKSFGGVVGFSFNFED